MPNLDIWSDTLQTLKSFQYVFGKWNHKQTAKFDLFLMNLSAKNSINLNYIICFSDRDNIKRQCFTIFISLLWWKINTVYPLFILLPLASYVCIWWITTSAFVVPSNLISLFYCSVRNSFQHFMTICILQMNFAILM